MNIRPFRIGDELQLHAVFRSSIHGLATRDYSPEQLDAWAPANLNHDLWRERMRGIQPFVVEYAGGLVAYADVQDNGYIDHFFVAAPHAGRGVGGMLMKYLHAVAVKRSTSILSSDVSRTAQPFFERFGFSVVEQRSPVIRGVAVPNAFMRKELASDSSIERTSK